MLRNDDNVLDELSPTVTSWLCSSWPWVGKLLLRDLSKRIDGKKKICELCWIMKSYPIHVLIYAVLMYALQINP